MDKKVIMIVDDTPSSKINGAFDTFYYNKNMTMSSPFANEYFNYKKNRYEIDSKLTKSLPAKAIAKAKVPKSTTIRKMLTLHRCKISINTVNEQKLMSKIFKRFWSIHSGVHPMAVSMGLVRKPLTNRKKKIEVMLKPPNMAML